MSKPVIQVQDRTPWGAQTHNVTLEGNRQRPKLTYSEVWEAILVPKGGLEAMLLEGCLYTSSVAFCFSLGYYAAIVGSVLLGIYTAGGILAVVWDKTLTVPWFIRMAHIAVGLVLSLL